jgi:hypothetical protein
MFIPDPGSRVDKIPDPDPLKETKYFFTLKTDSKFSLGSGFFPITDQRVRICNTKGKGLRLKISAKITYSIQLDLDWFGGSGSVIGNEDPDPIAWKLVKINNKPGFLPFKTAFVPFFVHIYFHYYQLEVNGIFQVKILLFVTLKSDQDPDPH